LQSNDEK
jgi:hypothetical protein